VFVQRASFLSVSLSGALRQISGQGCRFMRPPILLFLLGEVSLRSNDKENCYRLKQFQLLIK
jgi:hypothetical protein